jgi:hypothetical protein
MSDVTNIIDNSPSFLKLLEKAQVPTIWKDSKYECIRNMSSRSKGAFGEKMASDVLSNFGQVETRAQYKKRTGFSFSSDVDRLLSSFDDENLLGVEIKLSTTWGDSFNKFKWQQLRSNQNYDVVVFIGLNPNDVKMWWCSKEDLQNHIFNKNEFRQHEGSNGDNETYWLGSNSVDDIPEWFRPIEELNNEL